MTSTEKQRSYIASIIEDNKSEYPYFQVIWESTPHNNEKYPDTRANYVRMILADRLANLSLKEADYFIKAYMGERGYHQLTARNILLKKLIK